MSVVALKDRGSCPLCGSKKSVVHIPFPQIPVVQCSGCGFLYSGKVLSDEDLASYYEYGFGSKRHLQGQIVNARINYGVMSRLLDLRGIHNVLDVGTGYGLLLKELRTRRKLDAVGVELSQQEANYACESLGVNVINAPLSESGLQKDQYDLVTSFEVIEHISKPYEFIKEMTEYVRPGGFLLIMTDNFESRMAQSLGAGFPKWIPHSHVSHFAPSTLRKAIEATKELTVIRSMSYTPWEVCLRDAYYKLRGIRKGPADVFDLESILNSEMSGKYKLFPVRRLLNRLWVYFRLADSMDGDMMYFVARKMC